MKNFLLLGIFLSLALMPFSIGNAAQYRNNSYHTYNYQDDMNYYYPYTDSYHSTYTYSRPVTTKYTYKNVSYSTDPFTYNPYATYNYNPGYSSSYPCSYYVSPYGKVKYGPCYVR